MSTPRPKPKPKKKPEPEGWQNHSHTPNYITILPPGEIIAEKIFEMGIDAAELARRMKVSVETIEKLIRFEIPLTESVAKKLEKATWMNADLMLRHEMTYRKDLAYAMEHPEIPAYLGGKIINKPKRIKKDSRQQTADSNKKQSRNR
jgi:plasmid maintenance system antidote protein VapI